MSEAIAETGDTTDASITADEAVAETPVVETATEDAPVTEAAPAVPVEVQAELDYLRNQNEQIVEYLRSRGVPQAQAQAVADDQTGDVSFDLFADDGNQQLARFLSQREERLLGAIDQRLQAMYEPIQADREAKTVAEGEQRLQDILADDISRNGDFVPEVDDQSKAANVEARKLVRTLADNAFPQVAQRYGMTPRAAEIAMAQAADQVRSLLKVAGVASVAQHVNRNATLAGVHAEPGSTASTSLVTGTDEILPEGALARKYAADARRNLNV